MLAGSQIDGEGTLLIGEEVPAGSVKRVAFNAADLDALPTQLAGLPCLTGCVPREDGVEASEEQQAMLRDRKNVRDRFECDVRGAVRVQRIDDVGVASRDSAELIGVWAGEDSRGHGWVREAKRTGGEEPRAVRGLDDELKRSASERLFFTVNLLRVNEVSHGSDERRRVQDLDGP